jgi:predicted dehydrogenase
MKSKRDEALSRELPDVSPEMRSTYVDILLDSAIHDIYVLRGLVGDPAHLIHADIWANGKACNLIWRHTQDLETQYSFLLLSNPGGRYRETVSIYCPNQRVFIDFPSPYLRNMPTSIVVEKAVEDRFVRTESLGSFEEAFKNELLHFHECITEGREPLSSGIEGRKDVAIMQNVIRAATQ